LNSTDIAVDRFAEPNTPRNSHLRRMSRFSLLAAYAVVATGLLVLLGWAFDIAPLKSVSPGLPMMKANTAFGFVLVGVGLILLHNEGAHRSRLLARSCGVVTALLGALTLMEYISGRDLRIDDLLFHSAVDATGSSVGRMSPAAALNFTVFGVTLLLLGAKRRAALRAADALLMLSAVIGIVALAGYLYNVSALYQFRIFSAMAVHTAAVFVVLAAALLAAPPIRGVAEFLVGDDLGATLACRLLPVSILVPPLVGYILLSGDRKAYYGTELGLTLFATSNVVIFTAVIFAAALSLRRADLKRRASEEALHASDESFRLLVEGVADYAILMLDPKGCVASWNPGAERIHGYRANEILGRHFSCFHPPEDSAGLALETRLDRVVEDGVHKEEGWRVRKDGSRFWADVVITTLRDSQGRVSGFGKIARDMTERKLAEEAARDATARKLAEEVARTSGQRLRNITDNLTEGLIISSTAGQLQHLNKAAYEILNFSEEDWSRRSPDLSSTFELATLDGRVLRTEERPFARIFAGEQLRNLELCVRRIDIESTEKVLSFSGQIVPDGSGGSVAFLSFSDVSVRKKAEQQLVKTMKELKRSNSELEQFSYVASHDLQEPLRMVAGYTQLLSARYKGRLDSDADEFIAYAVDGSNRMQQLIRDLLAYSRVGSGGKALRSISSELALHAALGNLRTAIEESGASVTHDSLPELTTDATQLSQVFQNLIGNAIKYRGAEVPRIHIAATRSDDNEWIFAVSDNGLGIAPEHFEKIFVLFQRLHGREIAGTGFGLAICKKMLEGLGGRIWVESLADKGSTFRFALPEAVTR
jgi:PAS domain S-box-containing protein